MGFLDLSSNPNLFSTPYIWISLESYKTVGCVSRIDMDQTITVEGMTCGHCEGAVEDALESVTGVSEATADRESDAVSVEGTADSDALITAVEDAGYDASVSL